jgi:hypothetical protein
MWEDRRTDRGEARHALEHERYAVPLYVGDAPL